MKKLQIKLEKQIGIGLFFFALLTMVLGACSDYYYLHLRKMKMTYQRVIPLFDEDTQKFGIAVGQAFKKTIRQAKAKNIRPSDKDKFKALAYDNYVEEFRAAGLTNSEESDRLGSTPTKEDKVFEGDSTSSNQSTSTTQKQVLAKVNQAMSSSESYLEATDKLADINNGIPLTVPAQEQVGLQRAIAALYYTLDAIDDLVAEGVLKGQSEKAQLEIRPKKAGFSFLEVFVAQKCHSGCTCTAGCTCKHCGNEEKEVDWWDDWGKCAAGIVGGALVGAATFASGPIGWTIAGTIGFSLLGAVSGCGEEVKVNDDEPSKEDDIDGNNDGTGQHEQLTLD